MIPPWPTRDECLSAFRDGDGSGVLVAVLDTGIDPSHPDFSSLRAHPPRGVGITASSLAITAAAEPDPVGHGTAIAGIIHRMAPAAGLLSIAVLDANNRQHRHDAIRLGALYAMEQGAHVLNCSFGVPGTSYTFPLYKQWTDQAFHGGRHVVAASSNVSADVTEWPSHLATSLGVTAADRACGGIDVRPGNPVPFAAPGAGIQVPAPGGAHASVTGSSFAAAHVTGLLARLLSVFPGLSPSLAREALAHLAAESAAG